MTKTGEQRVQKGLKRAVDGSSAFKYYIHDTAKGYALEMSGPFTEAAVPELDCCWKTAKTTLRNRSLTLDLRGLTALDESAKQWLASMNQEGAEYLPESFMQDTLAGMPAEREQPQTRRNMFERLSSALRGCAEAKL